MLIKYSISNDTPLDTLGVTRQGYIGKEKDVENNLGDHGVRKYDYETGRFNSIDPMFEKYYGWSPYQYCMNNPIWAKDWDGREPITIGITTGVIVGGAVTIGAIGWAYTEATNPGTTKGLYDAISTSFNQAVAGVGEVIDNITGGEATKSNSGNAQSASQTNTANSQPPDLGDGDKQSKSSQKDRTKGLKEQIEQHKKKLDEYIKDPLNSDNKGPLKKALDEGNFTRYNEIYSTRIEKLQKQIQNFENQLKNKGH